MDELFCISPNSYNFTLNGKLADIINGFNYLNININKCVNETQSAGDKVCLLSEEIDDKLSNIYFIFTSLDYDIDHNNSTQAHRKIIKTSSFLMNSKIQKRYYYNIRQVFYNTDFGYVFQDNYQEVFYQQDNYQSDIKSPDDTMVSKSNIGAFTIINENKLIFISGTMINFKILWLMLEDALREFYFLLQLSIIY